MKILIVDDSELIRQRLASMLQEIKEMEIVGMAGNAEETYPYFNGSHLDVIILDIHLPGENGIKILEKVKKKNKMVKVIILTNFPYPQYRRKCIELGADYFVDKSEEFELIEEILKEINSRRESDG